MIPSQDTLTVVQLASAVWGVSPHHVLGPRRVNSDVTDARKASMSVLRDRGFTFDEIGDAFDRDHTTAIYADRTIREMVDIDRLTRKRWEKFHALLEDSGLESNRIKITLELSVPNHQKMSDAELVNVAAMVATRRNSPIKIKREAN